jgi:hypothetical protein
LPLSVLALDTNKIPDLKPPLNEIPPSFWEMHGLAISVGAVIGVVVLLFLARALFLEKMPPAIPADALARQALEALRNHPDDAGTTAGVALHLRQFVQAALGLPAGEMTTRELLAAMRQTQPADGQSVPAEIGIGNTRRDTSSTLSADLIDAVEKLLEECDARRFAPAPPEGASGMANRALEIVARIDAGREPRKPAA